MTTRPRIVNNLPQFVSATERRAARTLNGVLTLGGTELATLVPRDTSTLINSQYKTVQKEGAKIVGRLGFTAEYALFVHETSGKLKGQPRPKKNGRENGLFWGPSDGQPEFLRKSFERAETAIRAHIKLAMKR